MKKSARTVAGQIVRGLARILVPGRSGRTVVWRQEGKRWCVSEFVFDVTPADFKAGAAPMLVIPTDPVLQVPTPATAKAIYRMLTDAVKGALPSEAIKANALLRVPIDATESYSEPENQKYRTLAPMFDLKSRGARGAMAARIVEIVQRCIVEYDEEPIPLRLDVNVWLKPTRRMTKLRAFHLAEYRKRVQKKGFSSK